MHLDLVQRLRCPICTAQGHDARFELDPVRIGGGEDGGAAGDVIEAYLVCERCRGAWPILGGIGILPSDLPRHLATHGNVYRRTPIADPRLTRYVLGQARDGADIVPFDEVVERYGDLLPAHAGPARPLDPAERALVEAVGAAGPGAGLALEVGCGVGRGVFTLAAGGWHAVGVDRSVARIRRARNVQAAVEFHLPPSGGGREIPIDLSRLSRERTDFLVADPAKLPFAGGAFGLVVVRRRDGEGAWLDPAAVRGEARRVAGPDARVLCEEAPADGPAGFQRSRARRCRGNVIPAADLRPVVHAATGLVALGMGVMPRWMLLVGAGLGLLAGWVVVPLSPVEARLRRPGERWLNGLRTYPVAVAALVLAFPAPAPAAAAWGVMAFGDAAASLVGRHVPAPRLFGHRKATWSGSLAFLAVGFLGAWGTSAFVAWTGGGTAVPLVWCLLAALAGGLIDLVPIPPDDNLPIAAAAGLTIAAGTGFLG